MHKIVYGAFKAVFLSIMFVIIWTLVFYFYRVTALNNKVESLMVTMQQEVSKNNYLPADSYAMYEGILNGILSDMNGLNDSNAYGDDFIEGFKLNYSTSCDENYLRQMESAGITASGQLNTPANYGDVAVIELTMYVNAPGFGFDRGADGLANEVQISHNTIPFTYTYQVPCLRYISVTH